MAEDQLGPKSPIVPLVKDQDALMQVHDGSISMRIRPGTKSVDMLHPAAVDPSDVSMPATRPADADVPRTTSPTNTPLSN
jgi:hypothetical protein